nr:cytochrome c biogenesis protein CcdA [Jiangella muralis]
MSSFGETAFSGSLALAVPVAALAGLVSFLSPCVLPLVPGYLGYVTGLSGAELASGRRGRLLAGVLLFILGFSAVFVSYGLLFGGLGSLLLEQGEIIMRVLGVVTIGLGLLFAGWLPGLSRDWHATGVSPAVGLAGAPLLGAVFGIGWTPCMGPTLAAVQALAFTEASAGRGALLSFAYCLGLGVPFLLAALAYQRATRWFQWVRQHQQAFMRAGGIMLIVLGVLLVTGLWNELMASMQGWIGGFEVAV